jgi:hypothetical protein
MCAVTGHFAVLPCVDAADARSSAIAGQEALVPTGVVLRPFGAATRRATLGG